MKGGGRIFGPRPRDYHFKLNKKVKSLARQSALAAKAQSGDIAVLDTVSFDTPKTKAYLAMLKALSLDNTKSLLITNEVDKNVVLSGRNVPRTKVSNASDVNTYDLVNASKLLITVDAIQKIESTFSK
jgi:large subunit ribosomal protein L4